MNITNFCWVIMLNILSPNASMSYQRKIARSLPSRMKVCQQVAKEAQRQNVNAILAITVAYEETRFQDIASSKGARGPMGAIPRYHCPNSSKCNYTKAGVLALKKFLKINKGDLCTSLAQYNRGLKGKCKEGRSEFYYAQRVIDMYNEVRYYNQEKCFNDPIK